MQTKKIPLTQGKFAIVDAEDYHYLKRFTWTYATIKGIERVYRHIKMFRGAANIHMEDFIVQRKAGRQSCLTHVNGNVLDMRKENLDFITPEHFRHLGRKEKGKYSSDYRGVSKDKKNNSWRMQIERGKRKTPEYKRIVKSGFKTEVEAALAYNEAAKEIYGKYANLNVIE